MKLVLLTEILDHASRSQTLHYINPTFSPSYGEKDSKGCRDDHCCPAEGFHPTQPGLRMKLRLFESWKPPKALLKHRVPLPRTGRCGPYTCLPRPDHQHRRGGEIPDESQGEHNAWTRHTCGRTLRCCAEQLGGVLQLLFHDPLTCNGP